MRNFNIDWPLFVSTLPAWEQLSFETKRQLIDLAPNTFAPKHAFDEADAKRLLRESLLRPDQHDKRLALGANDRAKVFSKVIRALGRNPFDPAGDRQDLQQYAADLLTNEERAAISDQRSRGYGYGFGRVDFGLAAEAAWPEKVLGFKDAADAHRWEKRHLPAQTPGGRRSKQFEDGSPYFKDKTVWEATRALVAAALDWTEPLPIAELPAAFPKTDEKTLWTALTAAIRYLWLFPRFRDEAEDMTPVIGVWPRITLLRHRPKPAAPRAVEPQTTFQGTVRLDDMQAALIAAAAEPLRILANGDGLYQKDIQRLVETLAPLPDWVLPKLDEQNRLVKGFPGLRPEARLNSAIQACESQGLLEITEDDRGRGRLTVTEAARGWLAQDPASRLAAQLETWREHTAPPQPPDPKRAAKRSKKSAARLTYYDPELDEFLGRDADNDAQSNPWHPIGLSWGVSAEESRAIHWSAAVAALFADHDPDAFLGIPALLTYHGRYSNPLLGHFGPKPKLRLGYRNANDELAIEQLWMNLLCELLFDELLPRGAIEIGRTGTEPCLRLHPIGRYMLGLTDELDLSAAPAGEVIVQPNFEVVFLGPAPAAEAAIGRFAQRVGQGVGTLFRLTRDAALAAAAAGFTVEQALADLRDATSKPLPKNVERELHGWFDATRRVKLRKTVVIDAPDEATAAKVHAAAGKHARRLAPQVVEVATAGSHDALIRKLKTHGVFVET
jgi:hypothetical protein